MRRWQIILLTVSMAATFGAPAWACRGETIIYSPQDAFARADQVFEATVTGGGQKSASFEANTKLEVIRVWKGRLKPGPRTLKSHHSTCYPYPFSLGEKYYIYLGHHGEKRGWSRVLRAADKALSLADPDRAFFQQRKSAGTNP